MVVFGFILGIIIPQLTAAWWPDRPQGFRMGKMISYALMVMWDILVANIQVAKIVLFVGHSLLVHTLHTDDPEGEVATIKTRYEARLKEIFV